MSCIDLRPICVRIIRPTKFAFRSFTMMKGADCTVHPPNSTAMVTRPFTNDVFPIVASCAN